MKSTVELEYDAERNIVFTVDHWDIKTVEDVVEFFNAHVKFFDKIGKKFYMISNVDGLKIHPSVLEYYGETARRAVGKYLLGFARWSTDELARMAIRTSSIKARLESHMFRTREEAVDYILGLQSGKSVEPNPPSQ